MQVSVFSVEAVITAVHAIWTDIFENNVRMVAVHCTGGNNRSECVGQLLRDGLNYQVDENNQRKFNCAYFAMSTGTNQTDWDSMTRNADEWACCPWRMTPTTTSNLADWFGYSACGDSNTAWPIWSRIVKGMIAASHPHVAPSAPSSYQQFPPAPPAPPTPPTPMQSPRPPLVQKSWPGDYPAWATDHRDSVKVWYDVLKDHAVDGWAIQGLFAMAQMNEAGRQAALDIIHQIAIRTDIRCKSAFCNAETRKARSSIEYFFPETMPSHASGWNDNKRKRKGYDWHDNYNHHDEQPPPPPPTCPW